MAYRITVKIYVQDDKIDISDRLMDFADSLEQYGVRPRFSTEDDLDPVTLQFRNTPPVLGKRKPLKPGPELEAARAAMKKRYEDMRKRSETLHRGDKAREQRYEDEIARR